jgi:hypothetical protein
MTVYIIIPILNLLGHEVVRDEIRNLSFEITLGERASFDSPVLHSIIYATIN